MSKLRIATLALVYVSMLGAPSESRAQTTARKSASAESVIQFRFGADSASPGTVQVPWLTRDARLFVSAEPILSDDAIEHVDVHRDPEGLMLCLYLFTHARAPLGKATEHGIGRQLAVLINGRVVSVARIMSSIGGAPVPISVGVYAPRAIADEVAERIISRWPQSSVARYCGTLIPSATRPSDGSLRGTGGR
jgi:hypothetical protein